MGRQEEIFIRPSRPRIGDTCHWCKYGIREGLKVRCNNPYSKKYGKITKRPTRTTCSEWRYKF